jgi:hypothetical protein
MALNDAILKAALHSLMQGYRLSFMPSTRSVHLYWPLFVFLYRRAAWQYAFDPDATMDQDFTTYMNGTPKVRHTADLC